MKLSKVLIPEVVMGRRSSGYPELDLTIKMALDSITFDPIHGTISEGDNAVVDMIYNNTTAQTVYSQMKLAQLHKPKTYHLCRDFGKALLTLKDREIIVDYLPEEFFGYISFPEGLINDVTGGYIYVGLDKTTSLEKRKNEKVIWISYFNEYRTENRVLPISRIYLYPNQGDSLTEFVRTHNQDESNDEETLYERATVGRLLLNAVLYLHSEDPELLTLKPSHGASHSKQSKHTVNGHTNLCTIPVIAINWDYKALIPEDYESAETFVETHLRWQRCGVGFKSIKLIWVKEHTRSILKRRTNNE